MTADKEIAVLFARAGGSPSEFSAADVPWALAIARQLDERQIGVPGLELVIRLAYERGYDDALDDVARERS